MSQLLVRKKTWAYLFGVAAGILLLIGFVTLLAHVGDPKINLELELYMTVIGLMYIAGLIFGILYEGDVKRGVALYILAELFLLFLLLFTTVNVVWWIILPGLSYWFGWMMKFNQKSKPEPIDRVTVSKGISLVMMLSPILIALWLFTSQPDAKIYFPWPLEPFPLMLAAFALYASHMVGISMSVTFKRDLHALLGARVVACLLLAAILGLVPVIFLPGNNLLTIIVAVEVWFTTGYISGDFWV